MGRESELVNVRDYLVADRHLIIFGDAGVGKSQLAAEFARANDSAYEAVWWVNGETATSLKNDLMTNIRAQLPKRGLPGLNFEEEVAAAYQWLRDHHDWLVICDNVEESAVIEELLRLRRNGHVLITARSEVGWQVGTRQMELLPIGIEAATIYLRTASGVGDTPAAADLAVELGCLPLALEQAATFIHDSLTLDIRGYLSLFRSRGKDLLTLGAPQSGHASLSVTWSLTLQRLEEEAPAAMEALKIMSLLSADDIPLFLITAAADPRGQLAGLLASPITAADVIRTLRRAGLCHRAPRGLRVHRLLQRQVRNNLKESETELLWLVKEAVASAYPDDLRDKPGHAEVCLSLEAHLLTVAGYCAEAEGGLSHALDLLELSADYLYFTCQFQAAMDRLNRLLALSQGGDRSDRQRAVLYRNDLGTVAREMGDIDRAISHHEDAIVAADTFGTDDEFRRAPIYANLALLLAQNSIQLPRALKLAESARFIADSSPASTKMEIAICHNTIGIVLRAIGDPLAAQKAFLRAFDLGRSAAGDDNPQVLSFRANYASVLGRRSKPAAIAEYKKILQVEIRLLTAEHLSVARTRYMLARLLLETNRPGEAHQHLIMALKVFERVLGVEHSETLNCIKTLRQVPPN